MLDEDLNDISLLTAKIEQALEDYNFIELASLSSKLEKTVQLLTNNPSFRKNVSKGELDTLEKLLVRVNKYQVETEKKFKGYTLRVSKQTKMQSAYKKSRG